jgi:predicted DNA-binding transcriptional regulator YafY
MSKKLAFERYYWFHNQVKEGKFPNSNKLAEKFQISQKQAQRDIEFMRDRLNAPLGYNSCKKGYFYEDEKYELPPIWLNEEEFLSLIISTRLASTIPDTNLKNSLYKLIDIILTNNSMNKININNLFEKVSVKNIEFYKVDGLIFQKILHHLYNGKTIKITYYSPHKKEMSERIVKPIHMLCYMGRWHLIAYCGLRKGLRNFALSRIKNIEQYDELINIPANLPDIKEYIDKTFGLLSDDRIIEVCLEFSSDVADWIKEQIWHEAQVINENDDGSICLKFPVSNYGELKGEILKYGSAVKVIYPEELKEEIAQEIEKMKKNYI